MAHREGRLVTAEKPDAYAIVTDRIIAALEAGNVPWRQPWHVRSHGPQRNAISGHAYRGINVLLTASARYADPRWITFKQALDLGGHVRKGEHGTPIVFFRIIERDDAATGEPVRIPLARHFTLFNAGQCDGLDLPPLEEPAEGAAFDPIEAAEAIVAAMPQRPEIQHNTARAFYRPATDVVHLPPRESFQTPAAYYATAFHELTHSTGHQSRVGREAIGTAAFGDDCYSREELIAEMGAAFLSAESGISADTITPSAAYIGAWLAVLKADSRLVISAAAAGQRAADFILDRQPASEASE
ncbi:MAG: zincin-like metallopeptidase domain-containing protein [Elusimicrobia bacterium]|nr:zincin-like metallopeptidase domain-containing protein [Elusimicrobiota bacterium]